jgi:drug/metabolite transporter (DMT)-like permease
MIYGLLLANVLLLVTGQMLWKVSVSGVTSWNLSTAISTVFSPYFIGGGILYVVATGLWLIILSKMPLSVAYPMQSVCYIVGSVAAFFIFKEHINVTQWMGMIVIMLGVFLIAK